MLAACSPSDPKPKSIPEEVENIDKAEEKHERGYYRENDSKLEFDKDIHFVRISEVNNEALNERPSGGITSQDIVYDYEDDLLYFFYDAILPTEDTEMIIVEEQHNHDYLLNHILHQVNEDNIELTMKSINNEFVINNKRLFLGKTIKVSKISQDSISVSVNSETYEILNGEKEEITLEKGDTKSTISITNYGPLNSIDDMTYQVILDPDGVLYIPGREN